MDYMAHLSAWKNLSKSWLFFPDLPCFHSRVKPILILIYCISFVSTIFFGSYKAISIILKVSQTTQAFVVKICYAREYLILNTFIPIILCIMHSFLKRLQVYRFYVIASTCITTCCKIFGLQKQHPITPSPPPNTLMVSRATP